MEMQKWKNMERRGEAKKEEESEISNDSGTNIRYFIIYI